MAASPKVKAELAGELTYFTGKPCKHGHTSEHRTDNGACIACAKRHTRKYYDTNKDGIIVAQRVRRAADKKQST